MSIIFLDEEGCATDEAEAQGSEATAISCASVLSDVEADKKISDARLYLAAMTGFFSKPE